MPGFPFLSLTREIRDMIYGDCLEVYFPIVPHPTDEDWGDDRRQSELPQTALLAVSKQVRAEARPILYSKNWWRFPRIFTRGNLFDTVEPWLFHSIEFPLTGLDVPPERLMIRMRVMFLEESENPTITGTEAEKTLARAREMHDDYLGRVVNAWDTKVTFLEEFTNLKEIAVKLDYFCCPHGCCRLELFQQPPLQRLLKLLQDGEPQWKNGNPEVWFDGLCGKEEETLFFEVHGFEDMWAKWKAAYENHDVITDDTADPDAHDEGSGQDAGDDHHNVNEVGALLSEGSVTAASELTSQGDGFGEEDDGSAVREVSDGS